MELKKQHALQLGVYIRGMEKLEVVTFGEWLTEKLQKKDVSARRFGLKIGVSAQTALTWAKGEGYPTRDKMPLIADYFGIDVSEVWEAYQEIPAPPHSDATLARLLDLPDDLRKDETIVLRHVFRALRAAQQEIALNELRDSSA